jgi:hypothetical protein
MLAGARISLAAAARRLVATYADSRGAIWLERVLLVVLAALFIGRGFVPGWRTVNTDFPNYYLGARLYRRGYPMDRVYDWIWFQRQKDHAGIPQSLVGYSPQTLFSALPLVPLSELPPLSAKHAWMLLNLAALIVSGAMLCRLTHLGSRRIALLALLCVVPLRTNFLFGQFHVFMLLLLIIAAWCCLAGRDVAGGIVIGLATAFKVYPVLFIFYFLRKRRWRAAVALIVSVVALEAIGVLLFGFEAMRVYHFDVLSRALKGENIDPYNAGWDSLTALLRRLLVAEPELNPHPLIHLPKLYAVVQPIVQASLLFTFLSALKAETSRDREKLEWASFIVFLLLFSTNPASYHFAILILSAVFAADVLLEWRMPEILAALVFAYVLVSYPLYRLVPGSPHGWSNLLAFPRLYATMALAAIFVCALRRGETKAISRWGRAEWTGLAAGCVLLAGTGVYSTLRHVRGQFDNYATRVPAGAGSLMAIQPVFSRESILFTALTGQRYQIGCATGRGKWELIRDSVWNDDRFHPAADPTRSSVWIEQSGLASRVERLTLQDCGVQGSAQVEAENGEQPVLSPGGESLGFVREIQGRGGLWVKALKYPGTSWAERQLVDSSFDVLDFAFAGEDTILFSARPNGGSPRLFSVNLTSQAVSQERALSSRAVRFPAVSPNAQSIVFCMEEGGHWTLWLASRAGDHMRRLTSADCNAYTPAWSPDSASIVYASDCGRGWGLTALSRLQVPR